MRENNKTTSANSGQVVRLGRIPTDKFINAMLVCLEKPMCPINKDTKVCLMFDDISCELTFPEMLLIIRDRLAKSADLVSRLYQKTHKTGQE